MKTKHFYFATANTGAGFVSYLDNLNSGGLTYIIKGGSGTGKSTMMKKIANHFADGGEEVELYYCSTDTQSLDGVFLPAKNILLVDGTAPHIVNPKFVGATHKVIDVGQFVDDKICEKKEELLLLDKQKKLCFDSMYARLKSAKMLDDANFEIAKNQTSVHHIQTTAKMLFSKIKNLRFQGKNCHVFLQSINAKHFNLEKKNNFKNITFASDRYQSFLVMEKLKNMLDQIGAPYTIVHDCLSPEKIKNIIINNQIIIKNTKNNNKKINFNQKIIKKLINFAKNDVSAARKIHQKIEEIYVPNVHFAGIDKLTKNTILEIAQR